MAVSAIPVSSESEQNPFAWLPAVAAFMFLEGLVAFQAFSAYEDHFLTVAQSGRGISQGLPFIWHFAMWSDFFVISSVAAYVIGCTFSHWRWRWIWVSLAIGIVSALIMNLLYTLSNMPEGHVQNHRLTNAGIAHLIYMIIATAVFVQFLCFTSNVSQRLLRIVSVLLFVHVFIGTHMVLGIIKLYHPLDWYPVQPLESYPGWITVAVVGVGLAERNVGLGLILWFANLRYPDRDEDYLKLLDFVCKVVNRGYFTFVAGLALGRGESLLSIVLIVLLGFVYYLSRLSVWQELEIGRTLYPSAPDRVPGELLMKDRMKITVEVFVFMMAYVAAAWTAHCILVVSLLMFVIACIDLNTRRLINEKTREYFREERYAPKEGESDFEAIKDRRAKAERFLFGRRHLEKEVARIIGFALAFGIANFAYFANAQNATFGNYCVDAIYCALYRAPDGTGKLAALAYVVMIATLIVNECITLRWRIDRDIDFGRLKKNDSLLSFFTR